MTIFTKIEINEIDFSDYRNLRVQKSVSEFNSASFFTVIFDSPAGRHATDFNIGEEIVIWANDSDTLGDNQRLLVGIVEKVNFIGKENTQIVELKGRDYTLRLQDITVEPVVYTNSEVSTIVTNIMDNNVSDITTNNVDTTEITLPRMVFNHLNVFEALNELAKLSGFFFYIDKDKDLHFKKINNVSSGITLDNTNILKTNFKTTRERMTNSVWVYGDRYLAGFQEVNRLDGSTWGGEPGSVFTLLSKPHNTLISYLGNPLKGQIFDITETVTSGPDYYVNFHDKQLIFISGTDIGYSSIPISGGSIFSTYDRELPIVKFGEDRASITKFGKKVKIINDKSIKDPNIATNILQTELQKSNPLKGLEIDIDGWFDLTPGNTIKIVLNDFNIDDIAGIIDIDYTFDRNKIQSEQIIKVRLDRKITDLTDEITDIRKRLTLMESQDRQDTDVLTRLESATGSLLVRGSIWFVQTRQGLGSSFILGGPGTNPGSIASAGGRLGSVLTSGLSFLGDSRNALSAITSGGNF